MRNYSRVVRHCLLAAMLVAAAITTSSAQGRLSGPATLKLDDIPWPAAAAGGAGTSGVSGIQAVVLKGDPTKPGMYVLALRAAPEHDDPGAFSQGRSRRNGAERHVVLRLRPEVRRESAQGASTGTSYTEPPNTPHFARTKDEVIIQIVGYGPSSTTYVNPADDPAKK